MSGTQSELPRAKVREPLPSSILSPARHKSPLGQIKLSDDGEVVLDEYAAEKAMAVSATKRRSGMSERYGSPARASGHAALAPAVDEKWRSAKRESSMPMDRSIDDAGPADHSLGDEQIGIIRETLAELDDEDLAAVNLSQKLDQVSNDSKPKSMRTPKQK